jgi:signal peptidase I
MIAGRRIRLWSGEGVTIRPDERFSSFIVNGDTEPELMVEVFPGRKVINDEAVRVFDAQLMEERPEGPQKTGEPFWEILKGDGFTYTRVSVKDPPCNPVLVMPDNAMSWQIFTDAAGSDIVDPLPYPVDGLLLYFLSSARGDIMIHGSGVVCGDHGWVFTGRSGSGKTTLARIFDTAGDKVIHDDRLILRRGDRGWMMHSTPVYRDDEPRSASIDHLWGISHGSANVSIPVTGAEAAGMLLSNCIQQNWDRVAATRLAEEVAELVNSVHVSRLTFMPDTGVRDYLIARASVSAVTAAGAASAILGEEMTVTITAGGYSMWPAIRPGDKVIIEPLQERIPRTGDIVALRRDGGYVVHRIREVYYHEGRSYFLTQGDAVTTPDEPAEFNIIAGIVNKIIRSGKGKTPQRRIFPVWVNRLVSVVCDYFRRKANKAAGSRQ